MSSKGKISKPPQIEAATYQQRYVSSRGRAIWRCEKCGAGVVSMAEARAAAKVSEKPAGVVRQHD